MKKRIEVQGLTGLVATLEEVKPLNIDENTIGGTGPSIFTSQFKWKDVEGKTQQSTFKTRHDLIIGVLNVVRVGGEISKPTLFANTARYKMMWFDAELEETLPETPQEPPQDEIVAPEGENTPEEENPVESVIEATPSAKGLANQNNINLRDVTGTGAEGKVTKPDVQKYLENLEG